MGFAPGDKKKKLYFPPTLTKLTGEQAMNLVVGGAYCSDQDDAEFLEWLRREEPQENAKHLRNDAADERWKRSA